jgi:NAD(P)-dependent dehydrogenase (short-subunit alcohol dehydrogenase family)
MSALREKLLDGSAIAIGAEVSHTLADALSALGASLETVPGDLGADEERPGEWARECAPLQALVYDSRPSFGSGGDAALAAALQSGWAAVREVATGALIPGEEPGKVVLIGPPASAGPLADAARAGLESLARTLSVEWARHGVTTVMVAPGENTTEAELAELICFLVSEAGGYLSGCKLELGVA